MSNAQDYKVEERRIKEVAVKITSYRLGDAYYCQIANADPGATIARANGATRRQAMDAAISKAVKQL